MTHTLSLLRHKTESKNYMNFILCVCLKYRIDVYQSIQIVTAIYYYHANTIRLKLKNENIFTQMEIFIRSEVILFDHVSFRSKWSIIKSTTGHWYLIGNF